MYLYFQSFTLRLFLRRRNNAFAFQSQGPFHFTCSYNFVLFFLCFAFLSVDPLLLSSFSCCLSFPLSQVFSPESYLYKPQLFRILNVNTSNEIQQMKYFKMKFPSSHGNSLLSYPYHISLHFVYHCYSALTERWNMSLSSTRLNIPWKHFSFFLPYSVFFYLRPIRIFVS